MTPFGTHRRLQYDSSRAAQLYAIGMLVLGIGGAISDRDPATALTLLAGGFVVAAFVLSTRTAAARPRDSRFLVQILAVGIGGTVLIGVVDPPLLDGWFRPLLAITGAAAIGALVMTRLRTLLVVGIVLGQLVIWTWMIHDLDLSDMDVHLFQQQGSAALLEGKNPYELRYLNIYGEGTDLYAPELQSGEYLEFGFPYPPLSLLMAVPGYALAGDYRYAAAFAGAITGLLLAFARPGAIAAGIAALFMLSPLTLRVIYNGWTEPFVGALLAAVVWAAIRRPRLTPVLLGLLVAAKQYVLPVLLPAVVLLSLVRRSVGAIPMILVAAAVAGATILPFLLWNPGEFIHSVVLLQAYQPFRADSVGIAGAIARMGGWEIPAWTAFGGSAIALALATKMAPRTPAGFAGATALFFLVFFLLSKQAFMNYYYVVFVALACSVAAAATASAGGRPRSGQ